jgi:hypothetical protein
LSFSVIVLITRAVIFKDEPGKPMHLSITVIERWISYNKPLEKTSV